MVFVIVTVSLEDLYGNQYAMVSSILLSINVPVVATATWASRYSSGLAVS